MGRHLKPLELENIQITDRLFGSYVRKVSEKIIPHQWNILNDKLEDAVPTYCIQNFRIAAGEMEGKRRGVVFQDTDLYKWLETVAYCLAGGHGKEYEVLADEVIDLIEKAQEEDGYLNTYFSVNAPEKKWSNLVEGHELYTAGHLIEAAVAYYEAVGKEKLLKVARKNADLICRIFGDGEGQMRGYPGHQEIELALVKLYRVTGERKYLDTARYFIRERGKEPNYFVQEMERRGGYEFFPEFKDYDLEYSQAHTEPRLQKTAEGHAVRAMYMCSAMADLAEECCDTELEDACRNIWENVVQRRMYITGGIGSSGFRERFTADYDLPNATNYSETCASIGLMMFGQRMASVTGEASYYDVVERALYNTVLAGINVEGDRYFYVNPLEMVPEFCTAHTYMDHVKPARQEWFSVACCPPNVARTLASLGQYIYAQDEEALYIHQFISSDVKTEIGKDKLSVSMESRLLQNGKVMIQAGTVSGGKIRLRIPDYAGNWNCQLNGMTLQQRTEKGYLTVSLKPGMNTVLLDLDIRPRWVAANNMVRADAGKAALMKGPMVYCLEEKDNGKLLTQVYVKENEQVRETDPIDCLPGEIPVLCYSGIRMKNGGMDDRLYGSLRTEREPVNLRAVPYGLWNNRGTGEMTVWQKIMIFE